MLLSAQTNVCTGDTRRKQPLYFQTGERLGTADRSLSVGLNGSIMAKMTRLSFTYFFHFIKEQKIHIRFHRGRLIRGRQQLEFVTVVAKWITLAYYKVINKIVSPSLPSMLGELCSLFGVVSTLYKACPHWSSLHGCVLTVDAELMSCGAMFQSYLS